MATPVDIFADLTNRRLVQSSRGPSDALLATPFHLDKLYWRVQPLTVSPTGAYTSTPFQVLDGADYSLTVLVTDSAGTTLAGPVTSWSVDGTAKAGSIDLNTAAMATAFTSGSTTQITAYVYFKFDDGANGITTIRASMTIARTYITAGTPSELPLTSYLTREECIALFVQFAGNPNGASITLKDSTGTYETVLKCNSDGSNASNAGT